MGFLAPKQSHKVISEGAVRPYFTPADANGYELPSARQLRGEKCTIGKRGGLELSEAGEIGRRLAGVVSSHNSLANVESSYA